MKTLRVAAIAATAILASVMFAGSANAGKVKDDGGVVIGTYDFGLESIYVVGRVASTKKKCVAGRKVQAQVNYSDGPTRLVDVDVTSSNGAWGLVLLGPDTENATGLDVVALEKKIKLSKKKTLVCTEVGEDLGFVP